MDLVKVIEAGTPSTRRFPAPVEGFVELLIAWGALTDEDPLALPLQIRQRRRRELLEIRRDEEVPPHVRARQRQRRTAAKRRAAEAAQVERLALAARLVGACA